MLKHYGKYPRYELIVWVDSGDPEYGPEPLLFDDYYVEEDAVKMYDELQVGIDFLYIQIDKVIGSDIETIRQKDENGECVGMEVEYYEEDC